MDFSPVTHPIIKIEKKSIDFIRKKYGISDPKSLKEAINILSEWIQQQPHFINKEFVSDPLRLEKAIITSKGSLERAKRQIDTICTFTTLAQTYFKPCNAEDMKRNMDDYDMVALPHTTDDFLRIALFRMKRTNFTSKGMQTCWNHAVNLGAHFKEHDYVDGFVVIFDFYKQNMFEFIKHANLTEAKKVLSILTKGFGMRIIKLYFITESKMAEIALFAIKQISSKKVADKAEIITTPEALLDRLPRKVLPKDYGGDEQSIDELSERFVKILLSKEHTDFMKENMQASTDESLRLDKNSFEQEYIDMSGTFRTLNID